MAKKPTSSGKSTANGKQTSQSQADHEVTSSGKHSNGKRTVSTQTDLCLTKQRRRRGLCCCCLNNKVLSVLVALAAVFWGAPHLGISVPDAVESTLNKYNITVETPDFAANFSIPFLGGGPNDTRRVGYELYEQGLRPHHPVVIVPGFVTSGIELWKGHPCAQRYFRQRIWGSMSMTQSFLTQTKCWMDHMSLNATTGLDPDGVKLRATEGLQAVDYFMPGYHVWAKLIEALGDMDYDSNNLLSAPYDWRLSVSNMERRDQYFTRLKALIEVTVKRHEGRKVMIISHSWGDNVFRCFLHWANSQGDKKWVESHVGVYANVAGPVLGVPKALTALLSGEMKETAELGFLGNQMAENLVPRPARVQLYRSWGSLIGMLPTGGVKIWGNSSWAPDDDSVMGHAKRSLGSFLTTVQVNGTIKLRSENTSLPVIVNQGFHTIKDILFQSGHDENLNVTGPPQYLDIDQAMDILLKDGDPLLRQHIRKWGAVRVPDNDKRYGKEPKGLDYGVKFVDPLTDPLPAAPSLQMFCLYGVNIPVERSYYYLNETSDTAVHEEQQADEVSREKGMKAKYRINTDVHEPETALEAGVQKTDGDGTVPLISLGLLCRKGWRGKKLNPAGLRVVTREYKNELVPMYQDPRGGPESSDHVNVLSNIHLLKDILRLAAGKADTMQDRIYSEIDRIAERVEF